MIEIPRNKPADLFYFMIHDDLTSTLINSHAFSAIDIKCRKSKTRTQRHRLCHTLRKQNKEAKDYILIY